MTEDGEQADAGDILPLLLGRGEPADRPARMGGVDLHTILVIAGTVQTPRRHASTYAHSGRGRWHQR